MRKIVRDIAWKLGLDIRRRKPVEEEGFRALCEARRLPHAELSDGEAQFLKHCLENCSSSKSQLMQDLLADFVLAGRPGVFCEFGATDGREISNSYFLEAERDWNGVLAEPGREWHDALRKNRPKAAIDLRCVYSVTGQMVQFNEVENGEYSTIDELSTSDHHRRTRKAGTRYPVETVSLNDLLAQHKVSRLDYLSIDTEGSELMILQTFDFARYAPRVVTVEHNYTANRAKLQQLLLGAGYVRVFEKYSQFDDWYLSQDAAKASGLLAGAH